MDKIAALRGLLDENPTDAFARYGLAMAYAGEGRHEEALREYDRIVETSPDYVPAYQMSAQLLLKLGRHDQAKERLQTGLAAAGRTANTHAAAEMQAMLDDLAL